MTYIVGVDIGGTFTDCIVLKSAADGSAVIKIGKASSTPPDFQTVKRPGFSGGDFI